MFEAERSPMLRLDIVNRVVEAIEARGTKPRMVAATVAIDFPLTTDLTELLGTVYPVAKSAVGTADVGMNRTLSDRAMSIYFRQGQPGLRVCALLRASCSVIRGRTPRSLQADRDWLDYIARRLRFAAPDPNLCDRDHDLYKLWRGPVSTAVERLAPPERRKARALLVPTVNDEKARRALTELWRSMSA